MAGKKGRSGRPRKPDDYKERIGDHHKSRRNENRPDKIMEHPRVFGELSDEARQLWEWWEPMLYNNGTLSATDAIALTVLCETAARWYKYHQQCLEHGELDERGKIADRAKLEQRYRNELDGLLREFGLNPQARSTIEKIGNDDEPRGIKSVT